MKVSVSSRELVRTSADWIALPLFRADPAKRRLRGQEAALDRHVGGSIRAALGSGDFQGRAGEILPLYPTVGGTLRRVLLIGLGEADELSPEAVRSAAGRAVRAATARKARSLAIAAPTSRRVDAPAVAQALAEGAVLGAYRFEAYREKSADRPAAPRSVTLAFGSESGLSAARAAANRGVVLADSQNVARDLSNEPPNELPPASLARYAQKVGREVGLKTRVMGVPELQKRGMGGILAVGAGSSRPPRLIVMDHSPPKGRKKTKTLCIVGKGITFDSGGISIKPAGGMDEMKHDMSGAAAVVGAMRAAALLGVPHRVVGVIAAAENLPSGTAYRPGDIVKTLSGKTIEILNTDAEGRVVLADALFYAAKEFAPHAMIDLATLTGACQVALGPWASGVFSTDAPLVDALRAAGDATGERVWPLPLFREHKEAMRSQVADLKNTGGRFGGASTAAGFLSAFAGETPWAHLDIAGTGYTDKAGPCQPRGATGVGVRLLLQWMRGQEPGI